MHAVLPGLQLIVSMRRLPCSGPAWASKVRVTRNKRAHEGDALEGYDDLRLRPVHNLCPASATILLDAVRCWRETRDCGNAVQPALYAQLGPHGWGLLAPVLDGLFAATEAGLGRRLDVGGHEDAALSRDELSLLAILDPDSAQASKAVNLHSVVRIARASATLMLHSVLDSAAPVQPNRNLS